MAADIEVSGNGVYTISGQSEAGIDWMEANVDGAEGGDTVYSDQSGYTQDIVDGAFDEGLTVLINGNKYVGNGKCEAA